MVRFEVMAAQGQIAADILSKANEPSRAAGLTHTSERTRNVIAVREIIHVRQISGDLRRRCNQEERVKRAR